MALPPAQVLPVVSRSSDTTVFVGAAILRGFSVRETSGSAAASAVLRDGTNTSAPLVAEIGLASLGVDRAWYADNGILLRTGLFLDFLAGALQGEFYVTPVSNADDLAWAFGANGPLLVHPNI